MRLCHSIVALTKKDANGNITQYGLECQVKRYHLVQFLVSQNERAFFCDMEGGRVGAPTKLTCDEDGTLAAFLDKWDEVIRSADPSRIAAQVISGVSFLGTGVIFVKRGNPLGLTTAAGIWATAAVGLAIGSGLYILGIFTMLLVLSLQFMLHKFSVGDDAFAMRDILLSGKNETDISNTINRLLTEKGIQIVESKFSRSEDNDLLCHLSVRVGSEYTHKEALKMLQDYPEIKSISA